MLLLGLNTMKMVVAIGIQRAGERKTNGVPIQNVPATLLDFKAER
jgi:hypothetical protein